jgi:hypothetical protein
MTSIVEPSEFVMNFTFKLAYTETTYYLEILSTSKVSDLFRNLEKVVGDTIKQAYYIVVAGQELREEGRAFSPKKYSNSLYEEFGEDWKNTSFYIRPVGA